MKKLLSLVLSCLLIISFVPSSFAIKSGNIYYVDPDSGNDSNSGLATGSAWKTLNKINQTVFEPGDKILLKAGGIFSGSVVCQGNGEPDEIIEISSYGDVSQNGLPVIRNDNNVILVSVNNVSYWKISNISFTAPEGRGIYVTADGNNIVKGITVSNCKFDNIYNKTGPYCDHFPIYLGSSGKDARLDGITIKDCKITNCSFGISMGGQTREWSPDTFVSAEESYNRNYLIDGVTLNHIWNDGIIIGSVYGMVIRNCALIDTSIDEDHFTAPMWSHHASNYVIENCEIAGATNTKDGMAVDFDGWTTDATYQYVYSHDNVRFINNCLYDNYTCNDNCTVRYCLSVNDNKATNSMCQLLSSGSVNYAEDEIGKYMTNYKFYNNTIINCSQFLMTGLKDAIIANNIFTGDLSSSFITMKKSLDDNDDPVYYDFDGVMTNNCFSGTGVPFNANNNFLGTPGFVSKDVTDKNSFKLTDTSKLLGKGIQVEKDMGETDFYGNKLTSSHNIGCYDGEGECVKNTGYTIFDEIGAYISSYLGLIYNFIDNCNRRYWLF